MILEKFFAFFGVTVVAPEAFAEFLRSKHLPLVEAEVAITRENVMICLKRTWEILLYGDSWPEVAAQSHSILKDIRTGLGSGVETIAVNAVSWAGPRLAFTDAIRSLGVSAIGAASGPAATLLTQPNAQPLNFAFSYVLVLGAVFLPALLLVYLTK